MLATDMDEIVSNAVGWEVRYSGEHFHLYRPLDPRTHVSVEVHVERGEVVSAYLNGEFVGRKEHPAARTHMYVDTHPWGIQ